MTTPSQRSGSGNGTESRASCTLIAPVDMPRPRTNSSSKSPWQRAVSANVQPVLMISSSGKIGSPCLQQIQRSNPDDIFRADILATIKNPGCSQSPGKKASTHVRCHRMPGTLRTSPMCSLRAIERPDARKTAQRNDGSFSSSLTPQVAVPEPALRGFQSDQISALTIFDRPPVCL